MTCADYDFSPPCIYCQIQANRHLQPNYCSVTSCELILLTTSDDGPNDGENELIRCLDITTLSEEMKRLIIARVRPELLDRYDKLSLLL